MQWFNSIWYIRDILIPIIDISVLTILIYNLYIRIAQTRAVEMVRYFMVIGIIYGAAYLFNLTAFLWMFRHALPLMVVFLGIIYQPELRRAFSGLGSRASSFFRLSNKTTVDQIETVLNAMQVLASKGRGALVVFPRRIPVRGIIDSGTRIQGEITGSLLLTIFDHDTPLHDGAVIVQAGKIHSAGCFLPISEQSDIRKSFGSRHRAALGMAEETDAVILIVSEETGSLSLAYNANLYYDLSPEVIRKSLIALLNYQEILPEDVEEVTDEAE